MDSTDFLLQAVLTQNHHLILKHVSVVLFEKFLVGEVDAELFEGVFSEVLEAEDIEQVD